MANPALGSHTINTATIGANSYSTTAINTSASGSSFIVFVACASGTTLTVSDTINGSASGNTWTVPAASTGANPQVESNDGNYLWVFLCANGHGGTSHVVTANGGTSAVFAVNFIEITGATASDGLATAYATTYPLSCPVTTTQANDAVLGVGWSGSNNLISITPTGTGFTALDSYSGSSDFSNLGSAYLTGATTGSHDPAMTDSHAGSGLAVATIALKGAASPGGSNKIYLRRTRQRQIGG